MTAASAVMICASSPCTIILPRRLLRLSIQLHLLDVLLSGRNDDLLDNGTSYQFPTLCFGMHGSADRIKISSCTPSTEYGEHLLWGIVSFTRCTMTSFENHSLLLGIDVDLMHRLTEHLMQQLVGHRYNGYMQQLMKQQRRSIIVTSFDTNLNAPVRSYNVPSTSNVVTTNGELRSAMRSDMQLDVIWTEQIAPLHECHLATSHHHVHYILPDHAHISMYGFGLSSGDGLNNHWNYYYRLLGLILGIILLLQRVMGNPLQTADLFISISSRRGVKQERKFPVNTDLISICKYMGIFYVRGKVHRQTIFREGNEGKSMMVDLSVF